MELEADCSGAHKEDASKRTLLFCKFISSVAFSCLDIDDTTSTVPAKPALLIEINLATASTIAGPETLKSLR